MGSEGLLCSLLADPVLLGAPTLGLDWVSQLRLCWSRQRPRLLGPWDGIRSFVPGTLAGSGILERCTVKGNSSVTCTCFPHRQFRCPIAHTHGLGWKSAFLQEYQTRVLPGDTQCVPCPPNAEDGGCSGMWGALHCNQHEDTVAGAPSPSRNPRSRE